MNSPRVIVDRQYIALLFARRAVWMLVLIAACFSVLLWRMYQLQIVHHEKYQTRSEANRIQVQPIAPVRGLIYDRNGVILADNVPVQSLRLVLERVEDIERTLAVLREVIGLTADEEKRFSRLSKQRRRPYQGVPVRLKLSDEDIARLAVNRFRLPGAEVEARLVRHYPFGAVLAHPVGSVRRISTDDSARLDPVRYSGTEFVGKTGVEQFYEGELHGEVGYQWVETDARGAVRRTLDVQAPQRGQNITLHLDLNLQIAAHAALGERRGAIVAMDPASGGVLAMVSNPGYDPNLFVTGMPQDVYQELITSSSRPLFNRAIQGQYAPGSTVKPVVGLAALGAGATTWDRIIQDDGEFRLPGKERVYRDWSWTDDGRGGQGEVDLTRAIYRSSNVYFYSIAHELGIDRIADMARQFGLGQNLAVDIPAAAAGLVPDPLWKRRTLNLPWYPGDSINIGIGQGALLATPMQLATLTSALARRAEPVRPKMLLASDAPLSYADEHSVNTPVPALRDVTPLDLERMVEAMEAVVHRNQGYRQNGTAWAYIGRNISYRMAGKSGTAQVVEIAQGEEYDEALLPERHRKHAWFIAFAPAQAPRIALSVLVENGGGGSSVAAPVARAVIDYMLLAEAAEQEVAALHAQPARSASY